MLCVCLYRQFDFDKDPRDTLSVGAEITRFYLYSSPESRFECVDTGREMEVLFMAILSLLFNKKCWASPLNNDMTPQHCLGV